MKFHINPETGNPGKCSAQNDNCPFGGDADHYGSEKDARRAFELKQEARSLTIAASSKKVTKTQQAHVTVEIKKAIEGLDKRDSNLEESRKSIIDHEDKRHRELNLKFQESISQVNDFRRKYLEKQDKLLKEKSPDAPTYYGEEYVSSYVNSSDTFFELVKQPIRTTVFIASTAKVLGKYKTKSHEFYKNDDESWVEIKNGIATPIHQNEVVNKIMKAKKNGESDARYFYAKSPGSRAAGERLYDLDAIKKYPVYESVKSNGRIYEKVADGLWKSKDSPGIPQYLNDVELLETSREVKAI